MAGQDESLKLAATVVDQWSPQLRAMQRSLRSLAAETGDFHKKGIIASKGHTEALLQLRREVGNVSERVKSGLAPALAGLGLSGLSAAAGITAVAKSIVDFAGNARHLTFLSRQTQLTVQQLRVFEELAPRIGTSVEAMDSALAGFSEHMEKLRRAPLAVLRESFAALNVRPDPSVISGWRNLIGSLQGLGRAEQVGKIVQYLDRIRDMGQKRAVLQAFGLPPEFANKTAKELQEAINEIQKRLKPLTPEQLKGGVEFQNSIENIKTSLHGLRDEIGADLAKDMSALAASLEQFMSVHKGDIVEALRDVAAWAKSVDWAGVGADLKTFATGANSVAESLGGWKPILEFLAVYKVAQIVGLTGAIGGLARALGLLGAVASPPAWLLGLLGAAGAVAADRDRQQRGDKGKGGLYGSDLYGFDAQGNPETIPQGKGERGDAGPTGGIGNLPSGGAVQRPLWRRLFDSINKDGGLLGKTGEIRTGIQPAAYSVVGGGANPLLGGGGGDNRGAVRIIEEGTLAALRDFAAEQKGAEGGGGGGGAGGGGMGAIRANFAPGGGGGFGGAGAGTGEPAGGGGGAGTGATSPMGDLAGGLPKGIESLRKFHPPSIPAGMGGVVADKLKAAGISVPPAIEEKIRNGAQLSEGDLKSLPPATLEKVNKHITGLGQPPLYTDQKPQHFNVGDIRKSLEGTAAGGDASASGGGINRSWQLAELQSNPALKEMLFRKSLGENTDPKANQAVMEEAANRADVRGIIHGRKGMGLYGNLSYFANPGHAVPASKRKMLEENFNKVFREGSDISHGAIDNSSQGLAVANQIGGRHGQYGRVGLPPGRFTTTANFGGYHGDNRTGRPGVESFERPGWGQSGRGEKAAWGPWYQGIVEEARKRNEQMEAAKNPGLHGAALRDHFGHRSQKHADLLGHAREAGFVGAPLNHKVTGNASVDIKLAGFPRGTTTKTAADGMFKTVRLNRGRAMPPANQEG